MRDEPMIGPVGAPGMHVMTWNIRRRLPRLPRSRDAWARRRGILRQALAAESPTVLAVQEALPDQAQWVLDSLGPGYGMVGRGRDGRGGDEGTPLFLDSRRVAVEGWFQQALSDTPDVPGSRGWGNLVPRIVVVADLRDRATGTSFRVVNMHLDHLSVRSRVASAQRVRELVVEGARPAVVMGDANADAGSTTHSELTRGGLLVDSWEVGHRRTPAWTTVPNHRAPRPGRRIDWILVGGGFRVHAVGINAVRRAGAAASDHEPVQACLRAVGPGLPQH
ncbi:endonuclease/exonuclease/phosphatase family protein [Kytococcus sedentarius]|uniref:endonuclease/exonuclease/phosphatase family protein n=1 Tax=Kytococcus sedentarius TaxID=1276 RepID=UPI0035BBF22A